MAHTLKTKIGAVIKINDDRMQLYTDNGFLTSLEWELVGSETEGFEVDFARGVWESADVLCRVEIVNKTHFRRMAFHTVDSRNEMFVVDAVKRCIKTKHDSLNKMKIQLDADNNLLDFEVPPLSDKTCRYLRGTVISILRSRLRALAKQPSTSKEMIRDIDRFLEAYNHLSTNERYHYTKEPQCLSQLAPELELDADE